MQMGRDLMVTLPPDLTDQAGSALIADVSEALASGSSDRLLIDARGLLVVDSYVAQILRDLGLLADLLGARPVLVGLPAGAALVLSVLDVDLSHLHGSRSMDEALR